MGFASYQYFCRHAVPGEFSATHGATLWQELQLCGWKTYLITILESCKNAPEKESSPSGSSIPGFASDQSCLCLLLLGLGFLLVFLFFLLVEAAG